MVMEVDKVADEVADVDVDKVADMVVKITNEDFTHVILTIGDTFGDDVRGGAEGDVMEVVADKKDDKKVVE